DDPHQLARAHRARRDGRRRGLPLPGAHRAVAVRGRRRRGAPRVADRRTDPRSAGGVAHHGRDRRPARGRRRRAGRARRRRGRGGPAARRGRRRRAGGLHGAGRWRAGAGVPATRGGTTVSVETREVPPSGTQPRTVPTSDWSLSWQGVRTVTQLELRQRVRSTRWKIALVVWFVVVGLITLLTSGAVTMLFDDPSLGADGAGGTMFGVVVFFVLFLGLLVAPALPAPAINGDRAAGTLATLQATLLTPAEIVVGKLLAAWLAALAFLAASVPCIVWACAGGGLPFWSLVSVVLVLAVVLGVVCAVGLGFSALTAKTSGSAVLTYLTVGGLSVV